MSILGDILGKAHAILAEKTAITIEYSTDKTNWTALTGAIWHDEGIEPTFDEQRQTTIDEHMGKVKVPETGPVLTANTHFIRINSATVYAVKEGPSGTAQRVYRCKRVKATDRGTNRRGR